MSDQELEELKNQAALYGWTVDYRESLKKANLLNRKGVATLAISAKSKTTRGRVSVRYEARHFISNDLVCSSGDLANLVKNLLEGYFYCKRLDA